MRTWGSFQSEPMEPSGMPKKKPDAMLLMPEPIPTEEVGYARVSTNDQDPDYQIELLRKRGIPEKNLFVDVASGASMKRHQLNLALKLLACRPGWSLVVWKLDRLGRDVLGLAELCKYLEEEGINLVSLTEQIDTRSPFGRFYFHMLACLAQLEREMTAERTRAGLARLKEKGVRLGRRTRLTPDQLNEIEYRLTHSSDSIASIARDFGIAPPTINYFFPAWRSKTVGQRNEYRKQHPLPTISADPGRKRRKAKRKTKQ